MLPSNFHFSRNNTLYADLQSNAAPGHCAFTLICHSKTLDQIPMHYGPLASERHSRRMSIWSSEAISFPNWCSSVAAGALWHINLSRVWSQNPPKRSTQYFLIALQFIGCSLFHFGLKRLWQLLSLVQAFDRLPPLREQRLSDQAAP